MLDIYIKSYKTWLTKNNNNLKNGEKSKILHWDRFNINQISGRVKMVDQDDTEFASPHN